MLTRPLGATLGDELTKPHRKGGLALGTIDSSAVIAMLVIALITFTVWRQKRQTVRARK